MQESIQIIYTVIFLLIVSYYLEAVLKLIT